MEALATDAAFVRTSRAALHALVTADATSVRWWPGLGGEVTRRMVVPRLRRRVRSGLQACKDLFEARRAPGDEPATWLHPHQRRVWTPSTAATVDDRRMHGRRPHSAPARGSPRG